LAAAFNIDISSDKMCNKEFVAGAHGSAVDFLELAGMNCTLIAEVPKKWFEKEDAWD
jgi:hypothetical protein